MILKRFPFEKQLDSKDCGPTCLKIVSKYYGKYYSLNYLRELCGNRKEGISLYDLSIGAEGINFKTMPLECGIQDLINKIPLPTILHWKDDHFVVLYAVKKDFLGKLNFWVSDPAHGRIAYSGKEFLKKWIKPDSHKGIAMVLEPSSDFVKDATKQSSNSRNNLAGIFSYLKPYRKSLVNLLVVMLIVTVLQGILPFLSRSVIDVGIKAQDLGFINMVLIANLAILASILLSNIVRDWILLHITSRVNVAMISDYLIKLMNLPITFFENRLTGDILQRANDHDRIRQFIMGNSLTIIFSTLTFLVFSIVMYLYNLQIFLIFLSGSVIYFIWILAFIKIKRKVEWEQFELIAKNQSYWIETITCIQDIKLNNYEKAKRWEWEKLQARLFKVNKKSLSINNTQNLGAQFIDSTKNLLITFICAKAVIAGEITFGVLVATQFIIGMLNAPVLQFIQFIVALETANISFQRINEIHEIPDENQNQHPTPAILPISKTIVVNNLSFQYHRNGPFILKNINLIIPEGKITAIVGESGCGKSTLLKVLLRLYPPTQGDLQVANMNFNNIGLRQWRNLCGTVMQDGKIFNDTVLKNIVLDDENVDQQHLQNVTAIANITNDIEKMPLSYRTVLGEKGQSISGGQKQRLLIARAIYKRPEYLFMDEATNALDTINELKIVNALESAFADKTVLVVAHRLSTIKNADQIVVMHNGSIVEIGNHDSLIRLNGKYKKLLEAQLSINEISQPSKELSNDSLFDLL